MASRIEWIKIEPEAVVPSIEGRLLCSARDPKREAQVWWQKTSVEVHSYSSVVVLGLGAGFHLNELLISAQHLSVVFVVEKEVEIVTAWQKKNPRFSSQVQFLPVGDELQMSPPKDVGILEFRPAWVGNEKFYTDISNSLRGSTIHQIVEALGPLDQSNEAKIWRALRELVA